MREARHSTRRDFLKGQAAVGALQDLADAVVGDEQLTLPDVARGGYLVRVGRRAMACQFEVLLNAGQYEQGTEAALEALDLVDRLESRLTVFRDDSEVSRLNQLAHQRDVEVEPRLFALLARAAEIHRETAGAYDITTGPLIKAWGFYRRAGALPNDEAMAQAMLSVGMNHIQLDPQRSTVRFNRSDMEINLGSIGKGYALDRAAEFLLASGIEHFLLHGGNSSVLARGNCGSSGQSSAGWWIGVRHPLRSEVRIGDIRLHDRTLGTSGSGTQFFMHNNRRYGHILDPRSGRPAEGTLSVTVAAPSGADADALATAFYVMGRDASLDYCRRHPGLAAVIATPGSGEDGIEVTLWGLGGDQWKSHADDSVVVRRAQ